jgi:class 3 adenylate cyclase
MQFVNQIAEVTHSQVDKYQGSANKNIGDAFLLVWKFKDPDEFKKGELGTFEISPEN